MNLNIEIVKKSHNDIFGEDPELIVHSPGRINTIGGHTEESEGYVLPIAIDMGITLGISKIPDANLIAVYSVDNQAKMVSNYAHLFKSKDEWFNYPLGVTKILRERGFSFPGIRITFTGNLPQKVGLASSAAIEVASVFAINELFSLKISKPDLAKICQEAESKIVGNKSGVMDHNICLFGEAEKCLFIDCRSLETTPIALNLGTAKFVITYSNVPGNPNKSILNERIQERSEAVEILSVSKPGTQLRDFTLEDLEENKRVLGPIIWKRARHVISENSRVIEAKSALKNNDIKKFGQLLNESHESLKSNYEVSSPELDWLVEQARNFSGCYGSRMTGVGFGGCVISVMEEITIPRYKEKLAEYYEKFGHKPVVYEVSAQNGVSIIR